MLMQATYRDMSPSSSSSSSSTDPTHSTSSPLEKKGGKLSISLKRKPGETPSASSVSIKDPSKKPKQSSLASLDAKARKPPPVLRPSPAAVFRDSSSSDEEEMPAEARMRMRNIRRETATSSGPNSFGKTKEGFIDFKKLYERQLQEDMDKVSGE
uniref:PEST proteolytic signal-containing nuclear protein n=1 Tax=Caligus clemensi TaxID=344056 RepID=C1C131_CALCM|nr:PEST proteolytic signal-containing nuclear protein [Caligus clemensi]